MRRTKFVVALFLAAFLFVPTAVAQRRKPPTQEELTQRLEAKLGEAWLKKVDWVLDYDEALAAAKKQNKLIFGYFTRSYAP